MAFIAPILAAVGTVISAKGQLAAGDAANAAAKENAANAVETAGIQENQQRLADQRTLATGRADIGASGVQASGSPLDVMAESARQAEMNALIIRRGGQLQAHADLVQGANAVQASRINAASTILTGGYNISKQVAILGTPKAKTSTPAPVYGDTNSGGTTYA
jgi:hypothetical protein